MLAPIGAWFAAKSIPWKWIGVFLITLAVSLIILFGYLHVQGIQKALVAAETRAAQQELLRKEAEARADDILTQHETQVERIQSLEANRTAIASEVIQLRDELADLNEKEIESDDADKADAALGALNARNRAANRLLENASGAGAVRPNARK